MRPSEPSRTGLDCELVTNAFKHAGAGDVEVRFDRGDRELTMTVADTGPGLPEGFDPGAAEGFGWRMINGLIEQVNGEVRVDAGPGSGTAVEVRLPHAEAT